MTSNSFIIYFSILSHTFMVNIRISSFISPFWTICVVSDTETKVWVKVLTTIFPGQLWCKGCKHVVNGPSNDHVIVESNHTRCHEICETQAYKRNMKKYGFVSILEQIELLKLTIDFIIIYPTQYYLWKGAPDLSTPLLDLKLNTVQVSILAKMLVSR